MRATHSAIGDITASVESARRHDQLVLRLEREINSLKAAAEEDRSRVTSQIDHIRGLATGAMGGRPRRGDREAADLGNRVIAALASPQQLQALISELQSLAGNNGVQTSPVGHPLGFGRTSPV